MARRFASSTEQEIEKLVKQEDSENKRKLTKIAKELSTNTLRKKAFRSWKTRRTQMLKLFAVIWFTLKQCIIKQLLDLVSAISGIIKVSVSVISLSLRLRLITVTSTLIIADVAKNLIQLLFINRLIATNEETSPRRCF